MRQIPILFVSDSPDTRSGLARIARDLALRVCELPQFRVGFLGRGGIGSASLPFPVMQIPEQTLGKWGEGVIHLSCQDFFRGHEGIIFTIWDISRVGYIGWPEILADDTPSKQYLMSRNFKLWGYFPVDCVNVGNQLHTTFVEAYNRYDRKLFYTKWALDVALRSGVAGDVDWIPHGISGWAPQGRGDQVHADAPLAIGCVGTNQFRKDWGLTFATAAFLKRTLGELKLWAHVDKPYVPGRWNLQSLARQFDLHKDTYITTELPDDEMARNYSACDLTIANGLGEGFGLPIAESLACGVPVVHGDYGGAASWMRHSGLEECLVPYEMCRLEGEYGSFRPVFKPEDFGETALKVLSIPKEKLIESVAHLQWDKLWPSVWSKWFLRGLQ